MILLAITLSFGQAAATSQLELENANRFVVAAKTGSSGTLRSLLSNDAEYNEFVGTSRVRRPLGTASGKALKRFGEFARRHSVVAVSQTPGRVSLIWDCKQIDPPECMTELFFSEGRINQVDHWQGVEVSFDG